MSLTMLQLHLILIPWETKESWMEQFECMTTLVPIIEFFIVEFYLIQQSSKITDLIILQLVSI